jgi:hypothetical protein
LTIIYVVERPLCQKQGIHLAGFAQSEDPSVLMWIDRKFEREAG